ncbi:hypothetical protein [Klebsiella oxytoca]|uniref:hypothetical protein n=1 Tax=Klebsiella oxytoca TaxID=571 RepID=UPI0007CC0269|nr:hypothetical protein [Klebsiella oxytoca]SBM24167.1 Uncharacterised protein [Klebsiella oxytoca]
MAFTLSAPKTVQIHYLGGYLCDQETEIELIYAVESVRQDDSGQVKASLSVRYDDQAKIMVGDYPVTLDVSSTQSWVEQAEAQIMNLGEFSGSMTA